MTEPELRPEQEADVARLLAEAGGPVATPPEVVDRLDRVLAGLVAEQPRDIRRTSRWPRVLLAAAAVVLGGYGLSEVVGSGSGMDSDSAGSASSADAGGDSADEGRSAAESTKVSPGVRDSLVVLPVTPGLHSDRLTADVARVLVLTRQTGSRPDAEARSSLAARSCAPPPLPKGASWYAVRFDGRPATLVTERPRGGQVRARVWSCSQDLLGRASVPAPQPARESNRP